MKNLFFIPVLMILQCCHPGSKTSSLPAQDILPSTRVGDSTSSDSDFHSNLSRSSVQVIELDSIDLEVDTVYGVGDDGAFTAEDYKVFKKQDGKLHDVTGKLNDYNLISALKNTASHLPDTFLAVIAFPGLATPGDTNILIRGVHIFNGDRGHYKSFSERGAVKTMELYFNEEFIDTINLFNTYKSQVIKLNPKHYNLSGHSDTLSFIVKDIYPGTQNTYYLSEIKIDAARMYP